MEGLEIHSSALSALGDSAVSAARPAILTPTEYDLVVRRFNDTAVELPENGGIHDWFEAQVERTPHAIALTFEAQHLTYLQLNCQANQVTHALLAQGVRANDRVGIYAERSAEMVIGMLAVLKAGGAYVPLDPSYPEERLRFMSKDSSLVAILVATPLNRQLWNPETPVIALDQELDQSEANPKVPGLTSRTLAYVMYTSGSTGQPKGVLIEHRGVLRLVIKVSYAQIRSDDCIAHCASPSFDAATWEIWAALLNGARLLIAPQRAVLRPTALDQMLVQHSVTAMFLTVGLFNEYVDALERAFGGLRYLLVGGDKLTPSVMAGALAKPKRPRHLLNVYGPTEATTFATSFEIVEDACVAGPLPIGKPISNTQVYILDDNQLPLSIGVTGEIFIGGLGIARGYLERPELTAERFVADPYSNASAAFLYRTGDVGSWRADGNVELVGRKDFQVKIRGFRVEPGEIEIALQRYSGVKQAVVTAWEDEVRQKHLVAYVVMASHWQIKHPERNLESAPADSAEQLVLSLREHLANTMPHYMVPAAIVVLEKFPLTVNGKVDRGVLPAPDSSLRPRQSNDSAPSPVETTLAEIWAQVLRQTHIGINEDFFKVGGDSIMGLALIAKISECLSLPDLSVIDLFEHPTPREMAQLVESLGSDGRQ